MKQISEQFARRILSGVSRGIGPGILRTTLAMAEPFFSAVVRVRNWTFDSGLRRQHRLGVPVISVGNITTGGTGKTPAIQWITRRLQVDGHHPAILMRGYKSAGGASDEAQLLAGSLQVPVGANPNRVAEAKRLLAAHPATDVILLDDGFQHRRAARDLDVVLIDATNPFGFGHVLPRGFLREPLKGLGRASVFVLTRCDQVDDSVMDKISRTLRQWNPIAPILKAQHRLTRFIIDSTSHPIESIAGQRVFCFCGIGNPASFHRQVLQLGAIDAGTHFFDDHHGYSVSDLQQLAERARASGATMMLTTEKDWVKIQRIDSGSLAVPISVAAMEFEFLSGDAEKLLESIRKVMSLASRQ